MRSRRLVLLTLVSVALVGGGTGGCASRSTEAIRTKPKHFETGVERGRRIAVRECSACHAIDANSDSPILSAPPFREIRSRHGRISLEREFTAISQLGHDRMPPTQISSSESSDLIAFLESLNP